MSVRYIDHCEQELLQFSGAIQSHGALIVLDDEHRCRYISSNLDQFFERPLASWFRESLPATLQSGLNIFRQHGGKRLLIPELATDLQCADALILGDPVGGISIELYPHQATQQPKPQLSLLTIPKNNEALQQTQQLITEKIAEITGFKRVMVYLFREDGDGEIVAETVCPGGHYGSYLGQRFPASDIPRIARDLYLKTPWRSIPDAQAASIDIIGDEEPADLSLVDLRSVSPVHQIYLQNMGVRASLSFPIVTNGDLIGLVACHHDQPCQLPIALLELAAEQIRSFKIAVSSYQARHRIRLIDGLVSRYNSVKELIQYHGDILSAWPTLAPWLMEEFKTDGVCMGFADTFSCTGESFEADALAAFDDWFCDQQNQIIWQCDSLPRHLPELPLSRVVGVLAMRLNITPETKMRLYLTRQEHIHEVAWGGNPEKPVEFHDGQLGIAPRHSFEKWVEKRMGYSRPWDNESRLLILKLRDLLHSLFI